MKYSSLIIWVCLLTFFQQKGFLTQLFSGKPSPTSSTSLFAGSLPRHHRHLLQQRNETFASQLLNNTLQSNNDTYVCNADLHENIESERCNCARELSSTFIEYGVFHYCTMEHAPSLSLVILMFAAACEFFFLAKAADEYLVPAVEKYSNFLRLPPSVAGVTLLAFGNGAADVLASYASFVSGNAAIGVGAILGAGIFVISVVLGLVILTAGDFQAHKRDFLRDAIFYFGSVMWLEKVFDDANVYLVEAIVFVSIYFLYVLTVVFSDRVERLLRGLGGRKTTSSGGSSGGSEMDLGLLKDQDPPAPGPSNTYGSTNTVDSGASGSGSSGELGQLVGDTPQIKRQGSFLRDNWTSSLVAQYYMHVFQHKDRTEYEKDETHFIDMPESSSAPSTSTLVAVKNFCLLWFKRIVAIIEIPIVELAMRLTVPRLGDSAGRDDDDTAAGDEEGEANEDLLKQGQEDSGGDEFENHEKKYIKNLISKAGEHFVLPGDLMTKASRDTDDLVNPRELSFALLFSPLLICFTFDLRLRAYIISFLVGSLLAAWLHDQLYRMPVVNRSVVGGLLVLRLPWRYRFLFLTASFVMSIVWIYIIANELVELLATIGHIVGLSTSMLGLTVLAWGNSIGDLFADVILAKNGNGVMAASGCWGGPTFNILIGLGLGLIQVTLTDYPEPFPFNYSATAPIAFYFLLSLILFNVFILVFVTKFYYRRIHGFALVFIYLVFLILSVLTESGVFPVLTLF